MALRALAKPTSSSRLVGDALICFNELGRDNTVTLFWVPASWHAGIHGNERADELARAGAEGRGMQMEVGVPYALGKSLIRDSLLKTQLNRWQAEGKHWQAKLLLGPIIDKARSVHLSNVDEKQLTIDQITK